MGESIAELSRQQATQMLFDLKDGDPQRQTVESYFVIHVPGRLIKGEDSDAVALYGRQTHFKGAGLKQVEALHLL